MRNTKTEQENIKYSKIDDDAMRNSKNEYDPIKTIKSFSYTNFGNIDGKISVNTLFSSKSAGSQDRRIKLEHK